MLLELLNNSMNYCNNVNLIKNDIWVISRRLLIYRKRWDFPLILAGLSFLPIENLLKNNIVSRLKEIKDKYEVNVIEVIGHTDGVMARGNSNLDEKLADAVANGDISGLSYGSNADLGLMRALAVVFFLQKQPQLSGIKFRAYSAAQLIPPNEVAGDPNHTDFDTRRRRIELRFTYLED